jgi:hypothetical protein
MTLLDIVQVVFLVIVVVIGVGGIIYVIINDKK